MEMWAQLRSLWEMKDIFCQKFLTYYLPPPSHLLSNNLSGLSVIVTGATSGIGLQTAQELVKAGAHVIMACRNTKAANKIACQWKEEGHNSRILNVEVMELDLLSLSSVRQFAAAWEQREEALHILINNAGIFLMGEPQNFSDEGLEQHIHVNHIAPALLTLLLLPSLLRAPSSRIINVNSVDLGNLFSKSKAHHCAVVESKYWNNRIEEHKFSSFKAYGASKLAHLMFLKTLANKLVESRKTSVQCLAVHPGVVTTNLIPAFQKKAFWMFDPAEGARSVLFCATSADVVAHLVKGFAYYSCNCKPARMSPHAADMDACMEVWQKTMEILQLDIDYLSRLIANMYDNIE